MIKYHLIPQDNGNTRFIIEQYIERGWVMPDLLMGIVENDLFKTLTSTDLKHLNYLHTVVLWFYTEAPAAAIGSKSAVRLWIERGGREGIKARAEKAKQHLSVKPHPYSRTLERPLEPMD